MTATGNYIGCYLGDKHFRLSYYNQGAKDFPFDDLSNRVTEDMKFNINSATFIGTSHSNQHGCIKDLLSHLIKKVVDLEANYDRNVKCTVSGDDMGLRVDSMVEGSVQCSSLFCYVFNHIYKKLEKLSLNNYELVLAAPHNMTSTQIDFLYNCAKVALEGKNVSLKTIVPEPICAALYCCKNFFNTNEYYSDRFVFLCEKFTTSFYLYIIEIRCYEYTIVQSTQCKTIYDCLKALKDSYQEYKHFQNSYILTVHFTHEEMNLFQKNKGFLPTIHRHEGNIYSQGALLAAHYLNKNQNISRLRFNTISQPLFFLSTDVTISFNSIEFTIQRGSRLPYTFTWYHWANDLTSIHIQMDDITETIELNMNDIREITLVIDCWKNMIFLCSGNVLHVERLQLSRIKRVEELFKQRWDINKKNVDKMKRTYLLLKSLKGAYPNNKEQVIFMKERIEIADSDEELKELEEEVEKAEREQMSSPFIPIF